MSNPPLVMVHQAYPGEHDTNGGLCWCHPHVFEVIEDDSAPDGIKLQERDQIRPN